MKKIMLTVLCIFLTFSCFTARVWAEDEVEEPVTEVLESETEEGDEPETEIVEEEIEIVTTTLPGDIDFDLDEDEIHVIKDTTEVITLTATNVAGATYQWYKDNVSIAGATSGAYTLSASDKASVLHYVLKCVATYTIEEQDYEVEDECDVWVTENLSISFSNSSIEFVKGDAVSHGLSISCQGSRPSDLDMNMNYTWYKDDVVIPGANNSGSYTLTAQDKAEVGFYTYRCEVEYLGETMSASAEVLVKPSSKQVSTSFITLYNTSITTVGSDDSLSTYGYKYIVSGNTATLYLDGFCSTTTNNAFEWTYDSSITTRRIYLYNDNYIKGSILLIGNANTASVPLIISETGNLVMGGNTLTSAFRQGAAETQLGDLTIKNSASLKISGSYSDGLLLANTLHIYQTASIHLNNTDSTYETLHLKSSGSDYSETHGYTLTSGHFYDSGSNEKTSVDLAPLGSYIAIDFETADNAYSSPIDANNLLPLVFIYSLDAPGHTVTYQWYKCKTKEHYDAEAITSATSDTLLYSGLPAGVYSFYCVATIDGNITWTSGTKTVVIKDSTQKVLTNDIDISSGIASVDNLATEGWKWDSTTKTLTIENMVSMNHRIYVHNGVATTIEFRGNNLFYNDSTNLTFSLSSTCELKGIGNANVDIVANGDNPVISYSNPLTIDYLFLNITAAGEGTGIYNQYHNSSLTIRNASRVEIKAKYGLVTQSLTVDESTLIISSEENGAEVYGIFDFDGSKVIIDSASAYALYVYRNSNYSSVSIVDSLVELSGANNGLYCYFINTGNAMTIRNSGVQIESDNSNALYLSAIDSIQLIDSDLSLIRNSSGSVAYIEGRTYSDLNDIFTLIATAKENDSYYNNRYINSNNQAVPYTATYSRTGGAYLLFNSAPAARTVYTNSINGADVSVSASAVLYNGTAKKGVTYQWYEVNNASYRGGTIDRGNDRLVSTGATFVLPDNERGGKYYYCVASAKVGSEQVSVVGNVFACVTAAEGMNAITQRIDLYSGSDKGNLSTDGYHWDHTTKKLTLSNIEAYFPFSSNEDTYDIFCGLANMDVTIEMVSGSVNNLYTGSSAFPASGSTNYTWTITGDGVMNADGFRTIWNPEPYLNVVITNNAQVNASSGFGNLTISNNAKLNVDQLIVGNSSYSRNLVVDNGEINCGSFNVYGDVTLDNGAEFVAESKKFTSYDIGGNLSMDDSTMKLSVHEDAYLTTNGNISLTGDSYFESTTLLKNDGTNATLSISADSVMSIISMNNYGIQFSGEGGTIDVDGTLAIKTKDDSVICDATLDIDEDVDVIYPTNVAKANLADWIEAENPTENNNKLILSNGTFTPTPITNATISGTVKAGETLSVDSITPANATVAYQWQHSSDGVDYTDISGATSSEYTIKACYTGEYIRVCVNGELFSSGSIIKNAGRVAANPTMLKALYCDGELVSIDGDKFASDTTIAWCYHHFPTIEIAVEKNTEDAIVIIHNITNNRVYNSNIADVELDLGYNEIEISYTYNGHVNYYSVKAQRYATPTQSVWITYKDGVESSIEYVDSDGEYQTATTGDTNLYVDALEGSTANVYAKCVKEGYIFNMEEAIEEGYEEYIDYTRKSGIKKTITIGSSGTSINLNNSDLYLLDEPEVSVYWKNDNTNGLHIYAEWEDEPDNYGNYGSVCLRAELYEIDKKGKIVSENLIEEDSYVISGDPYRERKGFNYAEISHYTSGDLYEGVIGDHLNKSKKYELHLYYYSRNNNVKGSEVVMTMDASKSTTSIELNKHNVVLCREESEQDFEYTLNLTNIPEKDKNYLYLVTSDSDLMATSESSSKDYAYIEDEKLHVVLLGSDTVTSEGVVYLTVAYSDHQGNTAADSIAVSIVTNASSLTPTLKLKENSGKFNLFSSDEVSIPLNIINNDKLGVTSAEIVQTAGSLTLTDKKFRNASQYLSLRVKDDRTLVVEAIVPTDSMYYDWSTYYKNFSGTFEFYIRLTLSDGSYLNSSVSYKLTVANKAPTVKTTTVKMNNFYKNDIESMGFTIKGATIDSVIPDFFKANIPDWLRFADSSHFVLLNSELPANGKASAKVYLKVFVMEYNAPILVTVPVSVVNSGLKIKTKTSTLTLPETKNTDAEIKLSFYIDGKGIDYNKAEYDIALVNYTDILSFSAKDRAKYTLQNKFSIEETDYDKKTGICTVTLKESDFTGKLTNGSLLFKATCKNSSQTYNIPVTVKVVTSAKTTFTASKKEIKLNGYLGTGQDKQTVTFKSNASNIDTCDITYDVYASDDLANKVNSNLTITETEGGFEISSNSQTNVSKTYIVKFKHENVTKTADVKVSVTNRNPAIKVNKSSLTLNTTDTSGQVAVLSSSIKNAVLDSSIGTESGSFKVKITAPNKTVKENYAAEDIGIGLAVEKVGNNVQIRFIPRSNIDIGTYNAEITYHYPDGTSTIDSKAVKVKITVKDTSPSFKLSKSSVTLNKDMGANVDTAEISLSNYALLKGYGTVEVKDKNKADSSDLIVDTSSLCSTGKIRIKLANNSMAYGSSYTVSLTPQYGVKNTNGKKITFTVKVAAADKKTTKTKFDFALKSSGSIDLTRSSASSIRINQTYTNWMGTETANAPTISWKVIAKEGKNLYSKNGIVNGDVTAWFKDTDASTYGLNIAVDDESAAFEAGLISPTLKYTLQVTYTTNAASVYGETAITHEIALSVKQGTTKFKSNKSSVTLSKYDGKDKAIILISKADKDYINVNDIVNVEMTGTIFSKKVVANLDYLITESTDGNVYLVIGYKDDTLPAKPTSGTVKLNIYLKGNGTTKANGTVSLKINVK